MIFKKHEHKIANCSTKNDTVSTRYKQLANFEKHKHKISNCSTKKDTVS